MKPIMNFFLISSTILLGVLLFWPDVISRIIYPCLKFLGMVD